MSQRKPIEDVVEERTEQANNPDSTIEIIRDDLLQQQRFVNDDDLRARIADWIDRSLKYTDADTAGDYVENRLNELFAEYDMYYSPEVSSGDEAFPDDCAGCPHYGSSCPVLTNGTHEQARKRKINDAETERDVRDVYAQQARKTGCTQIPRFLQEWDEKHSDLVREGHEILTELADLMHETPDEDVTNDTELGGGLQ